MSLQPRDPQLCIETADIPDARTVAEVRKQLLRQSPCTIVFETSPGFRVEDGADTLFMSDRLFDMRLQDGKWECSAHSQFSHLSAEALAYMRDERRTLTQRLRSLSRLLGLPDDFPLFIYMSYSAARFFEDVPEIKVEPGKPEIVLRVYRQVVRYRNGEPGAKVSVLKNCASEKADLGEITSMLRNPPPWVCDIGSIQCSEVVDLTDEVDFLSGVRRAKEHILAGDIYQVLLSRRALWSATIDPVELYDQLAQNTAAPYMFYADLDGEHLLSASPELFVRCANGRVQVRPLAGTCPDDHICGGLSNVDKEAAEHLMLVDLARNDIARTAVAGTLKVPSFMSEDSYGSLRHLVSTIEAEIDSACDIWDIVAANFPAGTMTGAPKIRAMEIISDLEESPRGGFSGCIGFITGREEAILALIIRTIRGEPGAWIFQAGAGVVADSSAEAEWEECGAKIRSFAQVIEARQ